MKIKELTTLTKILAAIGVFGVLGTMVWYVAYPDTSQFLLSIMICIYWFGFTYLVEWTRRIRLENIKLSAKYKLRYEEMNKRLDSMDLWARKEFTKLNNSEVIHPDE